jgi:hypothetical protein
VPLPSRRVRRSEEQPALPLDLGAPDPAPPRARRARSRAGGNAPVQLTLGLVEEDEALFPPTAESDGSEMPQDTPQPGAAVPPDGEAAPLPRVSEAGAAPLDFSSAAATEEEPPDADLEPPHFDPDPFAEIPGMARAIREAQEFVLLPGSLRSRLDLREFSRFLASLPTVVKEWDGAPEVDDGGIRLRGPEGGAWIYPEAHRVRLVVDGVSTGPVGEDLTALCRWLETRAGMRLYLAGETRGAGADRSLDPWETFSAG